MSRESKSNTAIICLSPTHGGMEMDAFRIAKLLKNQCAVTLIVKEDSHLHNLYYDKCKELGINLETINFISNFSFSIIFNARKIIKNRQIVNVMFFGASELKSLYFSFIGLDINLIIRHGTTKSRSKKDILHRLIYSNVNYHVAICEHLANNVREIIPFGRNTKLKTIYSSLRHFPENLRIPEISTRRPISLLHVARVTDGKGQIDAIKACQILYEDKIDFFLNLVGDIDPDYKDILQKEINSVPYKNSIILQGFHKDVSSFYREADIFIFPSKGEGLSNSFIEALSYGLICIAYDNTSFPELESLGFTLFLARNLDIDSLSLKIRESVKLISTTPIPIQSNIDLALNSFSEKKELDSFMKILL